ncbi:protein ABIL2-like [Hibiscus syriacus]|uniref:protein ABIL2-like n=1 Tax=Hibiscus syriacus TaxID=106335 RepID=UPI001922B5E1|nr:protein ABIL2-like [Hibiscus syriacus]
MSMSRDTSNSNEVPMQQSLLFSESLKDLKNLRTQLYSAAEYFEVTYTNDDQKQMVVQTLKDYTIKALVNTIDHLGSMTIKVNDLLHEKVKATSGTELRVSCIEQRLRTCRDYIDREGICQQSLVVHTPKYHKRYILPVGETINGVNRTKSKLVGCGLDDEDDWHQLRNAVRSTIRQSPTSSVTETPMLVGKGHSPSPSPRPPQQSPVFSFTNTMPKKEQEKQTELPHRFPLLRSVSVSRPNTPNKSRSTTPISASAMQRYPSEPRKSASMRLQSEKDIHRDIDQSPGKSKRLLKALLSRRKSKKDEMLYTYLDEY